MYKRCAMWASRLSGDAPRIISMRKKLSLGVNARLYMHEKCALRASGLISHFLSVQERSATTRSYADAVHRRQATIRRIASQVHSLCAVRTGGHLSVLRIQYFVRPSEKMTQKSATNSSEKNSLGSS